jgi:hypothetical protein
MRSERLAAAALAAALLLGAGCSPPESFIVLNLRSMTATPITGVANIQVAVSKGTTQMRTLVYPASAGNMTIDQSAPAKTLSVEFSGGETGEIGFVVDALNSAGCSIGHGTASRQIRKGGVAFADVSLAASMNCSLDGGVPDAPEGGVLPGCDPVNPQSTAATVTTCAATQTCQVDCAPPMNAPARNECIAGGTGGPGTPCTTNANCQPGTQCFNYMTSATSGCAVKLCLRFCNSDADCTSFGMGGGGPGSFCQGPVMCPTFLTAYRTCTFNCDPRAAAAATRGGCPGTLACVMPGDMDQVDCGCPEPTRTKGEGLACASAAECAPGFVCNRMGGTQTCRPICRCNANASGLCTAANDCPTTGTTCRAVTNNTIYGICL